MKSQIIRNQEFRAAAREAGLCLWEVAERFRGGMSSNEFSVLMRKELDKQTKAELLAIVKEIAAERA